MYIINIHMSQKLSYFADQKNIQTTIFTKFFLRIVHCQNNIFWILNSGYFFHYQAMLQVIYTSS